MESENSNQTTHDRREEAKIESNDVTYPARSIDMMIVFESMWNGYLGHISVGKGCI